MFTTTTTTSDERPTAVERWRVAVADSVAAFSVRELGLLRVRGTIPVVDGVVEVDSAGGVTSLTATLDPAGVATGNSRRDADLRGRRLLDVASHPRWTFRADRTERTATGWTVHGTFEASRPVELALHVTETAPGRFAATATLDRRAAGVRAPRFLIGRRVDIELDVCLVRDTKPRSTS